MAAARPPARLLQVEQAGKKFPNGIPIVPPAK